MRYQRSVKIWLWIGVVMIFVQIILGGITRLTGSGLSITKWEVVTGIIPPLSEKAWKEEFDLYKKTPQYQKINEGMPIGEFKFIYFWEYLHRLWARSIGFVFIIPFFIFVSRGWVDKKLLRNLGIAVLLGVLAATFGWVMVASGLENRPWVSGYKLTIHLNLALLLFSWLLWIAIGDGESEKVKPGLKTAFNVLTGLIIAQLLLGGLMSGMKAGLYYPTWPDMYGEFFPKVLIDSTVWSADRIMNYEIGPMPGVVQFFHRIVAYVIFVFMAIIYWKSTRYDYNTRIKSAVKWLLFAGIVQICLGVLTVINCLGKIPFLLGVAHQITAILILSILIYLQRKIR
jgi:cytochrome c oxidase assembly protein subunit 15